MMGVNGIDGLSSCPMLPLARSILDCAALERSSARSCIAARSTSDESSCSSYSVPSFFSGSFGATSTTNRNRFNALSAFLTVGRLIPVP